MKVNKIYNLPQVQAQATAGMVKQHAETSQGGGQDRVGDNSPHIAQLQAYHNIANGAAPIQRQAAQGGLPGQLKSGIESLSGLAMDDVRVHYNSNKPAQLQAHAYAQGTEIHIAPGQERHLPHEAWHVVQQKQGRVKPTLQLKGIAVNDDSGLEREADVMGGRALSVGGQFGLVQRQVVDHPIIGLGSNMPVQRLTIDLRTAINGTSGKRHIVALKIEGRAPTTVSGSQGDHTVSSSLINLGLTSNFIGIDRDDAPATMLMLLRQLRQTNLDEDEELTATYAKLKASPMAAPAPAASAAAPASAAAAVVASAPASMDEKMGTKITKIDSTSLQESIENAQTNWDQLEGEDQNACIKDWIEEYIRLANKRDSTAFTRSDARTDGGGSERQASSVLTNLRAVEGKNIKDQDVYHFAEALLAMADVRPKVDELTLFMKRLLIHGCQVVPVMNFPKFFNRAVYWMWKITLQKYKEEKVNELTLMKLAGDVSKFFSVDLFS